MCPGSAFSGGLIISADEAARLKSGAMTLALTGRISVSAYDLLVADINSRTVPS